MDWLRLYHDTLNDPKVQRLPGDTFKAWVNLLCLANMGDERGVLPDLEDIAFALRVSEADALACIATLEGAGLLDRAGDGRLMPHNWHGRQYQSDNVTARVQRHRAAKPKVPQPRNVSETLHATLDETPPETESETDTEQRQKQSRAEVRGVNPAPKPKERAPAPTIPTPDQLVDELAEWADDKGVREILRDECERFIDHCLAGKDGRPVVYQNYAAAARKWITNPNFAHGPRAPSGAGAGAKFARSVENLRLLGERR
jgi:hypothetical protein